MKSNLKVDDEFQIEIPKELLEQLLVKLKLKAKAHTRRTGMDAVAIYLQHFCKNEFEEKDSKLYYNVMGKIGLSETTVRRALKGKIGSKEKEKDNYDVKYEMLDLLCYTIWQVPLLQKIVDPSVNWENEFSYKIKIPEYAIKELEIYLSNTVQELNYEVLQKSILNENRLPTTDSFLRLDKKYWDIQKELPISGKERISFLADINSSLKLLPRIIANEYYIKPSSLLRFKEYKKGQIDIHDLFSQQGERAVIIKISEAIGQGKTTFCWHVANLFKDSHNVIYINEVKQNSTEWIFPDVDSKKPILFLIDSCSKKPLFEIINLSKKFYTNEQLIFCLIDQTIRYKNISEWDEIKEEVNDEVIEVKLNNSYNFINDVFQLLISVIKDDNPESNIPDENIYEAKGIFINQQNTSLVDKIYSVLEYFDSTGNIKYKGFAWHVWEDLTTEKEAVLKNLFLVVANYFQFGVTVPIKIFDPVDQRKIIEFLSPSQADQAEEFPVILENNTNDLRLCHESIAKRFFQQQIQKNLASNLFTEHLTSLAKNVEFIHLLRNIYWLVDFKNSFLIESFKTKNDFYKKCLIIFETHYKHLDINIINDEIFKTQIEISKIYYLFDKKKAFFELDKIIKKNEEKDVHARTLLISYYTSENDIDKYLKALKLMNEGLNIEPDNVKLVKKIPNLFYNLAEVSSFSISDNLKLFYEKGLITLRALFFVSKILKLKFKDNPLPEQLSAYLNNQKINTLEEQYEWIKLEAVKNLPFEIGSQDISFVKFSLATKFNRSNEFETCIKLFALDNIEEIHPSSRVLLIRAFLKLEHFKEAQIHIDLLKDDDNEYSKKIALLKQIKLFFLSKQSVALLKNINLYLNLYDIDEELTYYIEHILSMKIKDSEEITDLIHEVKIIIRRHKDLPESWIVLFWLLLKQDNISEFQKMVAYVKNKFPYPFMRSLLKKIGDWIYFETELPIKNQLIKTYDHLAT
jgi:hypothetical protein